MSRYEDDRDDYWERYDDRLDEARPCGAMEESTCPACNGSGEGMYDGSRCRECGGTGIVWTEVVENDLEGPDEGELEQKGI